MATSESIKEALLLQEFGVTGLGHYEIEVKLDSSAAGRIPSTSCGTREAHRFENIVASRLDCCWRCEIEEDTEDTEIGRHGAKNLEVSLPLTRVSCVAMNETRS